MLQAQSRGAKKTRRGAKKVHFRAKLCSQPWKQLYCLRALDGWYVFSKLGQVLQTSLGATPFSFPSPQCNPELLFTLHFSSSIRRVFGHTEAWTCFKHSVFYFKFTSFSQHCGVSRMVLIKTDKCLKHTSIDTWVPITQSEQPLAISHLSAG